MPVLLPPRPSGSCTAPSMYLQCDSNGLSDEFCSFIKETLDGASSVFAGTNPRRKGDKAFGFAIFADGITSDALAGAAALYTVGGLSHIPRITSGGVHACRDCGLLDDDALFDGRPSAHANADDPLCGLHRRDVVSGRRSRPPPVAPSRATPQFVDRPHTPAPVGPSAAPPGSTVGLQATSPAIPMTAPTAHTRPSPSPGPDFAWEARMARSALSSTNDQRFP